MGNYISILDKRIRTEDSAKIRKRESYAKISSMASFRPNKNKPDSVDRAGSELGDEFEVINGLRMYGALISLLCVFLYSSSSSKMTNTIMLKPPDIYLFFDFEILSWSITSEAQAFKINFAANNGWSCFPVLLGLDR